MKKHILITGGTAGIGKLTAVEPAKQGHSVSIHGRNKEKLGDTITEIKESTGNKNIQGFLANFADLTAVRQMIEDIKSSVSKIDVLINNAGVFKSSVDRNDDGLDVRFVVNYLAPYMLTNELLDVLNDKESRIINLSSAAQATVSLVQLAGKALITDNEAYAQSKLALTMWTFKLAKELEDAIVIAVNPGSLLDTRMAQEGYGQTWAPAEKGSNILVDLALNEKYDHDSGKYFDNDKGEEKGYFAPAHADAYDLEKINKLIEVTESILKG